VLKQAGDHFQLKAGPTVAYLGPILFILMFALISGRTRTFLLGLATGASAFITSWAPYSYIFLLILLAAPCVGVYLVHTWPPRVDEENPMAKYRREAPLDDD